MNRNQVLSIKVVFKILFKYYEDLIGLEDFSCEKWIQSLLSSSRYQIQNIEIKVKD